MNIESQSQYLTTGDIARELGESPKRIAAIIYARQIPEARRVGNARIFDRDEVIPLVRAALQRCRRHRQGRGA